jgi:hypothetical protein
MSDHPTTPPPELVQQWIGEFFGCKVSGELASSEQFLANRAAQWGADQELEACLTEVSFLNSKSLADKIRAARRPKPPSLKEQALDELCISFDRGYLKKEAADTIRRALEQLDD